MKPENLLLCQGTIKISDFGWSVKSRERRKTYCGTTDYMAPEQIEKCSYDHTIDNWWLGVLLYEFLTGEPPFESNTSTATKGKIKNIRFRFPRGMSKQAKELIKSLLVKQPKHRLSTE